MLPRVSSYSRLQPLSGVRLAPTVAFPTFAGELFSGGRAWRFTPVIRLAFGLFADDLLNHARETGYVVDNQLAQPCRRAAHRLIPASLAPLSPGTRSFRPPRKEGRAPFFAETKNVSRINKQRK